MAINTEQRRAGPYKGDGVQRDFPFNFKVFEKDDIVVRLSADSGETERTLSGSDFDVELLSCNFNSAESRRGMSALTRSCVSRAEVSLALALPADACASPACVAASRALC